MNRLVLKQEDDQWVRLLGNSRRGTSKRSPFIETLRYGIKPPTYRRYDAERHDWLVHYKWLPFIARIARKHFDSVDWSTLPVEWQLYLNGASIGIDEEVLQCDLTNPYTTLFVTDDAPMEVIKASYKVLALLYHPDHGGDSTKMQALNFAFDAIKKLRTSGKLVDNIS